MLQILMFLYLAIFIGTYQGQRRYSKVLRLLVAFLWPVAFGMIIGTMWEDSEYTN